LPDAREVGQTIATLSAREPRLARTLAAGVAPGAALARLGMLLSSENRMADAAIVFRSAVALAPGEAALWMNYGAVLDRLGSWNEAAACFERSLALASSQADTWLLLGIVQKKRGDLAAAEAAYGESIRQSPAFAIAWQCLGLLKQDARDHEGAIECLEACLKHGGRDAATLANLGRLRYEIGQFSRASDAYAGAAALDPASPHFRRMAAKSRFLRDIIEGGSVDNALETYRAELPGGDAFAPQDLLDLLEYGFGLMNGFGHTAAARRAGAKYLELRPESPTMVYLMNAAAGSPGMVRAPRQYIVAHFDSFAAGFDAQLVRNLGYDLPNRICSVVRERAEIGRYYDALDAGCGTGLCGPHLRSLARKLSGVDLSQKMLDEAGKKSFYDELICEDLVGFLDRSPGRFDLVVAADVMIYLGDLAPVFASAAKAIMPGGLLAFSTEAWEGDGFHLKPTGRFAQSLSYVRSVVAGFEELACERTTIRLEANRPVPGHVFVFRRAGV
jgi:predicted TPR repeat methyltransferase